MQRRFGGWWAVTCLVLMLTPVSGWPQFFTGSISGVVADPSGAVIPNVVLTLTLVATSTQMKFTTSSDGHYLFGNLKQGTYELRAEAKGFRDFLQKGITINVQQAATLDMKLELGIATQTVEVTANASPLNFQNAEIKQAIPEAAVGSLPLQVAGNVRTAVSFAILLPGITAAGGSPEGAQINGGQILADDSQIDGVTTQEGIAQVSGMITLFADAPVPPEEVSEVSVLTSNYEPQYGSTLSSIISLVTKSGSAKFHGEAFEFLRNTVLNARQFGIAGRGVDIENEFGGNVGGPIKIPGLYTARRKSFFFFHYDRWVPRGGAESVVASYPTMQERQGDFSDWKDFSGNLIPIYDPATTAPNPNYNSSLPTSATNNPYIRQQFMGCGGQTPNVICSTDPRLQNTSAAGFFKFMPPPNRAGLTNNWAGPPVPFSAGGIASIEHRTTGTLRIDHYEGEKDHIDAVAHYRMPTPVRLSPYPIQLTPTPIVTYGSFIGPWEDRGAWDHTFSPTLLNTVNLGYNDFRGFGTCLNSVYANELPQIPGVQSHLNSPVMNFQNFTTLGCNSGNGTGWPDVRVARVVNDLATWVKGSHILKFGGEFRGILTNSTYYSNGSGTFNFAQINTGLPGIVSGSDIAGFLLGQPNNASVTFTSSALQQVRQKYYVLFAGDTWRATRKLTFSYGLRWDVSTPATELHNRNSFLDPLGPNPDAGNLPGRIVWAGSKYGAASFGRRSPEETTYTAFAPRIAIAYAKSDKTVIRTGYGIFYQQLQYPGWGNGVNLDGFAVTPSFSSSDSGITAPFLLSQGIPQNFPLPPDFSPSLDNGLGGPLYRPLGPYHRAYAQQWNLTVEHQFTNNFYISAAYVGNKGTHLVSGNQPLNALDTRYLSMGEALFDQFTPGQTELDGVSIPYAGWVEQMTGCAPTVAQALQLFPQYCGSLQGLNQNSGNSTYHSFQFKAENRLSHGTWLLASYTNGKAITNAPSSQTSAVGEGNVISPFQMQRGKALSPFDVPQTLSLAFMYQLPFGRGQRFLNHTGAVDKLVGGWQLTSIFRATSGPIFLFRSSTCNVPSQFAAQCIPGTIPGVNPFLQSAGSYDPGKGPLFNKAAFESPSKFNSYLGQGNYTSNLRGPGFHNHDLTFVKITPITEHVGLQFRAEFFNVWNWHMFLRGAADVGLDANSAAFVTDVASPDFGQWNGATTVPRTIQFSMKILF